MEQGSCSGADDLGIEHIHAIIHEYDGIAACGISRADYRTRIARIAHLPECGNPRSKICGIQGEVIDTRLHGLRIAHRQNALGIRTDTTNHIASALMNINGGIL